MTKKNKLLEIIAKQKLLASDSKIHSWLTDSEEISQLKTDGPNLVRQQLQPTIEEDEDDDDDLIQIQEKMISLGDVGGSHRGSMKSAKSIKMKEENERVDSQRKLISEKLEDILQYVAKQTADQGEDVRIFAMTWNMARKPITVQFEHLVP